MTVEISKKNTFTATIHEDHGDYYLFKLSRFQHGEIRYQLCYFSLQKILSCMCMLLKIDGFPCRHIFAVMKYLNIRHIPTSLIMKRWCKDAKSESPLLLPPPFNNQTEIFEMSRYGSLNFDAQMMTYYASNLESSYKIQRMRLIALQQCSRTHFKQIP